MRCKFSTNTKLKSAKTVNEASSAIQMLILGVVHLDDPVKFVLHLLPNIRVGRNCFRPRTRPVRFVLSVDDVQGVIYNFVSYIKDIML
jgi:hypothetical protein